MIVYCCSRYLRHIGGGRGRSEFSLRFSRNKTRRFDIHTFDKLGFAYSQACSYLYLLHHSLEGAPCDGLDRRVVHCVCSTPHHVASLFVTYLGHSKLSLHAQPFPSTGDGVDIASSTKEHENPPSFSSAFILLCTSSGFTQHASQHSPLREKTYVQPRDEPYSLYCVQYCSRTQEHTKTSS